MNSIAVGITFLLCAFTAARSEIVTVAANCVPSSPHVRFRVSRNGQPATGVFVVFYRGAAELLTMKTDGHGNATQSILAPDKYYIVAEDRKGTNRWWTTSCIEVQPRTGHSAFNLELIRMDGLGGVERLPATAWVQDFQGFVGDPTDAAIPHAKIRVYRQGNLDDPLLELSTDENGQFSEHLENGAYVAVFSSLGFQQRVVVFEVTPTGESVLHVDLDVGHT